MAKTVTLRLKEETYTLFRHLAETQNRTLSNFIETSVLRFIENYQYVDDYEMAEIRKNIELNANINEGLKDAGLKRGRFAD